MLESIAFIGYGSSVRSVFSSSPEFTTNGMLPKCWCRINRKIELFKGEHKEHQTQALNLIQNSMPFKLQRHRNKRYFFFGLSKWKGVLCSTCNLFTSKELAFVSVGRIVKEGGFEVFLEFCKSLGNDF